METIPMPSGTYTVLKTLRKSSKKILYLAHCDQTGQKVVLCKLLGREDVYDNLKSVTHTNLVRVLDVQISSNEVTYVILEYVSAPLLSEVLQQRKFSQREVLHIGVQLCDALHTLHSIGLIHRDVKPENIFYLSDGTIKLFDYDASRIYKADIDSDTTPMGTFGYAAPEQLGLKQSDARSDIYALGILLNILAVGEHPSVRMCGGALRRIVQRCIYVNPDQRYRNATQVQHALRTALLKRSLPAVIILPILLLLLLFGSSAAFAPPQSSAPTPPPSFTAVPENTPSPTASSAALPAETPYAVTANLPPEFDVGAYTMQEVLWKNEIYHLIFTTDSYEQDVPKFQDKRRRLYLNGNTELPIYLIVWPASGDFRTLDAFRSDIRSIQSTLVSQSGDLPAVNIGEFEYTSNTSDTLLAASLLSSHDAPSASDSRPLHHLVTVTVEMADGRTVPLQISATLVPDRVVLSANPDHPMETTEQLNALISALDEIYGPDTPVTLQLPATTYSEGIQFDHTVTLQGTPEKTVIRGSLEIDGSYRDDAVQIHDVIFEGNGSGSAITTTRNLSLSRCTFNNYDTCCTVPKAVAVSGTAITGNVPFEDHEAALPDLTTAAGLSAFLAEPPAEYAGLESFSLELPAVNYKEEVIVSRPVNLIGAEDGTTAFAAGLRYTAEDGYATVRNCSFYDAGYEIAIATSHDLLILDCYFRDFTYAAVPTGTKMIDIDFLDCTFDHVDYLHPGEDHLEYYSPEDAPD